MGQKNVRNLTRRFWRTRGAPAVRLNKTKVRWCTAGAPLVESSICSDSRSAPAIHDLADIIFKLGPFIGSP